MWFIKFITLLLIFGGTSFIGILVAKKYENRLKELQEIKNILYIGGQSNVIILKKKGE